MKKSSLSTILLLSIWVVFILCISDVMASNKVYLMTGKIKAIDQNFNTLVIEVPLAERVFTVGGPLDSGAVLRKGGKTAALSDFSVGERVNVKWRSTEKGHVIEMITSP